MNETKIEWCDYTINPVKGLCPVACSYCYARAMYKRFKWNPELRLDLSVFDALTFSKPSKVFVGSTIELFHDTIPDDWRWGIFEYCKVRKQHTFIFLTKQSQNLIKYSPFPENCWVGVTATNWSTFVSACWHLGDVDARVRFISFEPLLEQVLGKGTIPAEFDDLKWLIIGQQTPISTKTQPKIEWIQEIVEAADKTGIPVFLKENLRTALDLFSNIPLRQEFPIKKEFGGE